MSTRISVSFPVSDLDDREFQCVSVAVTVAFPNHARSYTRASRLVYTHYVKNQRESYIARALSLDAVVHQSDVQCSLHIGSVEPQCRGVLLAARVLAGVERVRLVFARATGDSARDAVRAGRGRLDAARPVRHRVQLEKVRAARVVQEVAAAEVVRVVGEALCGPNRILQHGGARGRSARGEKSALWCFLSSSLKHSRGAPKVVVVLRERERERERERATGLAKEARFLCVRGDGSSCGPGGSVTYLRLSQRL